MSSTTTTVRVLGFFPDREGTDAQAEIRVELANGDLFHVQVIPLRVRNAAFRIPVPTNETSYLSGSITNVGGVCIQPPKIQVVLGTDYLVQQQFGSVCLQFQPTQAVFVSASPSALVAFSGFFIRSSPLDIFFIRQAGLFGARLDQNPDTISIQIVRSDAVFCATSTNTNTFAVSAGATYQLGLFLTVERSCATFVQTAEPSVSPLPLTILQPINTFLPTNNNSFANTNVTVVVVKTNNRKCSKK